MSARRPVYVTHQSLQHHIGGASSVTAWVLQALSGDFDVRLATPDGEVDFLGLDDIYGTSLAQATIGVHRLSVPGWLERVPPRKLKSLRLAAALRDPCLHEPGSGLVFNTANEMGFRARSVNYVHCPIRHPKMISELFTGLEKVMRNANNLAFKFVSGSRQSDFLRAPCIANSQWTARALRRTYGIEAQVIYPPVTPTYRLPTKFADRSMGYVCVGRLTEEKRIHEAITVVDELRSRGHQVHLHIVGSGSGRYADRIVEVARRRSYVLLHSHLSRPELADLLDTHRFGLHMMRNEHFGMAVAEMTAAGMLVQAHRSAGPMEILGPGSPALFEDLQDAIESATRLLESPLLQEEVLNHVSERDTQEAFSPQTFMRMIRDIVEEALN